MKKARKDDKGRALKKGEYQRFDGSYEYRYVDPFKRNRAIYADTLMALREEKNKLIKDQLDGIKTYKEGGATVNYLFDRYIKTKTNLRPSTMSNYKYMYNKFVRDTFGKNLITEVKYSDVLMFYNQLISEKGLKIVTIENVHSSLHPAFELAVRDNLIRKNPSDGVMATLKKGHATPKTTRHALTLAQQRKFMAFVSESPFFYKMEPLFTVMLGTGCRVGEVVGLRWRDIDYENHRIVIDHNLVYFPQDGEETRSCTFGVSLPKTDAGIRTIPMFPQVEEALNRQKEYNRENDVKSETIDGLTDFIFLTANGKVITPRQINQTIKRIIAACNKAEEENPHTDDNPKVLLPDFSCHHLRHTFCTRLCENDTNVKVVQSVMGHADISTTLDIYTDVSESKKNEAMMMLAENINIF